MDKKIVLNGKKQGEINFSDMENGIKIDIVLYDSQDTLMRVFLVDPKNDVLYKAGVPDASYKDATLTKIFNIEKEKSDNIDAAFVVMYKNSFPIDVVSQGFLSSEYDLRRYYYRADLNIQTLPDFKNIFKKDYGVKFNSYTYKDIDLRKDILRYVFSCAGCRKSVFENGGFYYCDLKDKAIVGVVGDKQQDIFSEILPNTSFLPFSNEHYKGAFFVGVDFLENKIFPVIFKNKA